MIAAERIGRWWPALVVVPVMTLGGCGRAGTPASLRTAVDDYLAGRYESALAAADTVQGRTHGLDRDRAAYVAGIAAYRLDDPDRARPALATAARSSNAELAARSEATLGLIELDQGRPLDAARRLAGAASAGDLSADESGQAAYFAARAYQAAGDETSATHWFRIAEGRAEAPAAGSVAFTIQVGAFRQRRHAERAAADATDLAQRHGLTPVSIVPRGDGHGRTMFYVHFGRFATRGEAADTRSRLGRQKYIIAPLDTPTS